jgi:crotonobetainyl-CoA:carnitine CoA-transferase CaiB-like acyl-CoA transferase
VHVPYNSYTTADGHIIIAVIFDSFWDNLLEVIDHEPFRAEKYKTQPGRLEDKAIIDGKLNEILGSQSSDYWLARLTEKRIPCARVNRFSEALADEQVLARNMVIDLKHPDGSSTRGPGNPIKLSRSSDESFSAAPLLGQHTDTVLSQLLGYEEAEIERLRAAGAVA